MSEMDDESWFKSAWLRAAAPKPSADYPVYISWDKGSPDGDVGVTWTPLPGGGVMIKEITYGGRRSGRSHLRLVHSR